MCMGRLRTGKACYFYCMVVEGTLRVKEGESTMSAATGAVRRRGTPAGLKSKNRSSIDGLYMTDQALRSEEAYGVPWWKTALFAPYDHKPSTVAAHIVGPVMELVGTMIMVLVFNLVRANIAGDPLISALVLGIVSGVTYYTITGWHTRHNTAEGDNELPRHLGWTYSLANLLTVRTGLVIFVVYAAMQLLGALFAALIMSVMGVGAGVLPPVLAGGTLENTMYGLEFLGTFAITFTLIYNHYMGVAPEEEHSRLREAQLLTALTRGVVTVAFSAYGIFYFEPTLYLGAYWSQCITAGTCPASQPWGFYVFFPWVGAVAAPVFFWLILALYAGCSSRKTSAARKQWNDHEPSSSASHSVQAPDGTQAELLVTPFDR
jgi:hypothetical protein